MITVELEFSWFSSSSFIETRAFKINHDNENWNVFPYSTTKMPISTLIEKKYIYFPTHIAGRSLRPLHGVTTHVRPQVAQARNMSIGDKRNCCVNIRNIRICMGKKPIVSVTYENERVSIKSSLPYLNCVLRGPRPIYVRLVGFLCKPFSLPWTTQERRNTHFK